MRSEEISKKTKKSSLKKSSLCIMNVDDDDEVLSVTERERDPV